uniref:Neuromedin U C-terminal domain-containing protein n=1 Tax=Denticeps clupeoides TaxID=299321 RepID=A0AAY4DCE9_9TELE
TLSNQFLANRMHRGANGQCVTCTRTPRPAGPNMPIALTLPLSSRHGDVQIDDLCSYYLSADLPLQASDVLAETCFFMLEALQKHQVHVLCQLSHVLHPLLQLVPQLHTRRERRIVAHEDVQGPGGIQSRGYFLYRVRNPGYGRDRQFDRTIMTIKAC